MEVCEDKYNFYLPFATLMHTIKVHNSNAILPTPEKQSTGTKTAFLVSHRVRIYLLAPYFSTLQGTLTWMKKAKKWTQMMKTVLFLFSKKSLKHTLEYSMAETLSFVLGGGTG